MSEIPEIERLRRAIAEVAYADQPQIDSSTYPHGYFPFEEASQSYRDAAYALADEIMVPIRSALDRQAREIVEALRERAEGLAFGDRSATLNAAQHIERAFIAGGRA